MSSNKTMAYINLDQLRFDILRRKIQRNLIDYGLFATLKKGILYPIKVFFEAKVCRIYSINLEILDGIQFEGNDFTYKFIDSTDIKIIRQIELMEEWLHGKVQDKLNRQGICLVALDNETVAGFNLISFGEIYIPLLKLNKVLPEDEAWSEQITVHHKYRRRGLACNLRFRIFEKLKTKGIKILSGGTVRHNKASLKLAYRTGFREDVDIYFLMLFGFKKWKTIELNPDRAKVKDTSDPRRPRAKL